MTDLTPIRRLARSGLVDRAWAAFVSAGLDRAGNDGAVEDDRVLTLKGRLLKDRAMRAASPDERLTLLRAAAAAYDEASRLGNDCYPRINMAALVFLRGDRAAAAGLAADLIERMDRGEVGGETPYWFAATRAEALLLCDRRADADQALADAIALAPDAREDRAATLRQFRRILAATGEGDGWLARHALAPVMHFRGPMGPFCGDDAARVREAVHAIGPGLAYGALAAGTDLIAAEAALAGGAKLHIVLPCPPDRFRASSVVPFGDDWAPRFDRLIEIAETLEWIDEDGGVTNAAVRLADDMAMGLAVTEALAADDIPYLLRGRRAGADDVPVLGAPHRAAVVDLSTPATPASVALSGPAEPVVVRLRPATGEVVTFGMIGLDSMADWIEAGDMIDAWVPAPGWPTDERLTPRLSVMAQLGAPAGLALASRPAAYVLQANCEGCRPVLSGSADGPIGQFDLFDIASQAA